MNSSGTDFPSREIPAADARVLRDSAPTEQVVGDPNLLDQVLRQTLTTMGDGTAVAPECLEAMREVARRHNGEAVTGPIVAGELIGVVFQSSFPDWPGGDDERHQLLNEIVDLILTDPQTRTRLENLWHLLDKAQP